MKPIHVPCNFETACKLWVSSVTANISMSVGQRLVMDWKMEIKHQLWNGMPIHATAYIGELHVCTRIYKFQHGLARFTKLPANSDYMEEKIKFLKHILFKLWLFSRTVRHLSTTLTTVMYRTVSLSKPYTTKGTWAQIIDTATWFEPGIRSSIGFIIRQTTCTMTYTILLMQML